MLLEVDSLWKASREALPRWKINFSPGEYALIGHNSISLQDFIRLLLVFIILGTILVDVDVVVESIIRFSRELGPMELVFFVEWCQVFMICTSEPELLPNIKKFPNLTEDPLESIGFLNAINIENISTPMGFYWFPIDFPIGWPNGRNGLSGRARQGSAKSMCSGSGSTAPSFGQLGWSDLKAMQCHSARSNPWIHEWW